MVSITRNLENDSVAKLNSDYRKWNQIIALRLAAQ